MIYPIDPRPLPPEWLRVWRSLGLDVSGLEPHPEQPAEHREDPPEERAEGEQP
jgi:hypothetical protein